LANLALLYVIFGSTYLAIRVTVDTVPPLLGAGIRFISAGTLLYFGLAVWRRRLLSLERGELIGTFVIGLLVIGGGLGLLTVGERTVPSGLAALLIASVPAWVILLRTANREHVGVLSWVGVSLGMAGVAMLAWITSGPDGAGAGGVIILLVAAFSTAVGSYYAPRVKLPSDSLLGAAMQMLLVGPLLLLAGLAVGEEADPSDWSQRSVVALVYLIAAGSVVAYASFVWLISNTPALIATTYTYITPAIALFLGWLILDEAVTLVVFVSAAVICLGVAMIVIGESRTGVARTAER
jgi:drug/metabolite transporter (DMT)-like permease